MQDRQKDIWAALSGSDPKEMKIYMGGRQVGKSYLAQMWGINDEDQYSVIDQSSVDGSDWFTVKCSKNISLWIKQQPKEMWHEHIDKNWMVYKNMFDVHEKIYTLINLKYGDVRV